MDFYSKHDLMKDFEELGLKKKNAVLIHSSLKSIGLVEGGANTVIDALLDVIGEQGALMVPALTGKREDSPLTPPVFDVLTSPCWTGTIPETLRKRPQTRRSLHPTHSVSAIGSKKFELTKDHEFSSSPCDDKSPYYKNAIMGGFILFIGVAQESNTSIHMCEELAKVPYHLQKDTTNMIVTGYNGEKIVVSNRLHDWEKPETDFNKLDELYKTNAIMKLGNVGKAVVRLVNAANMLDFTVNLLKKDPLFLLV